MRQAGNLQNESGQLIERVSNLQAHKSERCHHQIETKMHDDLEPIFDPIFNPIFSCGLRSSA
jgi:hypothetical protein